MSLAGKHIVMTRASEDIPTLAAAISARGGIPLEYPCIAYQRASDAACAAFSEAFQSTPYTALLLTSHHAVAFLGQCLFAGKTAALVTSIRCLCIGQRSASAARERGFSLMPADVWPDSGTFVRCYDPNTTERICWPTSDASRRADFPLDWHIERHVLYRTLPCATGESLTSMLQRYPIDAITVLSGSAVRAFDARVRAEGGTSVLLAGLRYAPLGAHARAMLAAYGWEKQIPVSGSSMIDLVSALDVFL